jgi:hypothetical protein
VQKQITLVPRHKFHARRILGPDQISVACLVIFELYFLSFAVVHSTNLDKLLHRYRSFVSPSRSSMSCGLMPMPATLTRTVARARLGIRHILIFHHTVASAENATSEDRFVKSKRSLDVGDGEEVCDGKPILRPHGARDEFLLAATAQNLRKMGRPTRPIATMHAVWRISPAPASSSPST